MNGDKSVYGPGRCVRIEKVNAGHQTSHDGKNPDGQTPGGGLVAGRHAVSAFCQGHAILVTRPRHDEALPGRFFLHRV